MNERVTSQTGKKQNKNSLAKSASLISLGWELALPIFLGVLIGYQLDQFLERRYVFTLIFLFAGIGTGYYNLYKTIELDYLQTKVSHLRSKKEDN